MRMFAPKIASIYLTGIVALLAVAEAGAQIPKAFDVVSIKAGRNDERGFHVGPTIGGRYDAANIPVRFLITQAFGVQDYQVIGGPGWLAVQRYDIVAKLSGVDRIGEEQLRPLLQAMLADRFRLKFHSEKREFPGYSLDMGRGALKLTRGTVAETPNLSFSANRGEGTLIATKQPMSALARQLGNVLGRAVADNTGLRGDFDFKLQFTPPETADSPDPSILVSVEQQLGLKFPTVFTAVQEQLGLKLSAVKKTPVEVIVIDSIDKASEN
jgi:uncharacterized protein (TIGR03435 family)